MEVGERIEVDGGKLGGRGVVEKIGEKDDEAANKWRIGVGAEATPVVDKGGVEPDGGGAAADAVGVGAQDRREGRGAAGAVDEGGEAFLGVVDEEKDVDQALLHAREIQVNLKSLKMRAKIRRKWAVNRAKATQAMTDNALIPLPGFTLPVDFPWRIRFIAAVDEHLRRLRATGHFVPGRFFGYYFRGTVPMSVSGNWTVTLDNEPPVSQLPEVIDYITQGKYSIASGAPDRLPDFMLIHDRRDGACWLWEFGHGLRFVEAVEPVVEAEDASIDGSEKPNLLGP